MPAEIKVVPVGDGAVGKTAYNFHIHYHDSILKNFHSIHAAFGGEYPESLLRVADNWQGSYISNNLQCSLSVCDTSGADGHARIRAMSYPNTDVFLVLFSVVDGISFINVKQKWIPEIRKALPFASALLVGTKNDLRDTGKREVSQERAKDLVSELGLLGYVECSAKYGTGVREVLDAVLRHVHDTNNNNTDDGTNASENSENDTDNTSETSEEYSE